MKIDGYTIGKLIKDGHIYTSDIITQERVIKGWRRTKAIATKLCLPRHGAALNLLCIGQRRICSRHETKTPHSGGVKYFDSQPGFNDFYTSAKN